MKPPRESFSKRASIFRRVLDWINQGRFQDHGSWMLFGNKVLIETTTNDTKSEELYEAYKPEHETLYKELGDLQVYGGKVLDARRTTLSSQPPGASIGESGILTNMELPPGWRTMQEPSPTERDDDLDALYSSELIGKLDRVVDRAASLDPHKVDVGKVHDSGTRAYFQEAHRCYLYGFNAACAVMCRAILESALKEKVDPDGMVERNLPKGASLFYLLLGKSGLEEALKCGAEQVKKAGDAAAHEYNNFQREYQGKGKIEEGLAVTRDVLARLYPRSTNPEM
jgi:hypothetical protein